MNIHEYQAKDILRHYGVAVPMGAIALNPSEIEKALDEVERALDHTGKDRIYVVKAQIHAGGRGKAGGVKIAKTRADAIKFAQEMFGKVLVTHQTGPQGKEVKRVYFETGLNIVKEYYFSLVLDRSTNTIVMVGSSEGGMDIEEVAAHNPDKIYKVCVNYSTGLHNFHKRKLGYHLGIKKEHLEEFGRFIEGLYKVFVEKDASQVEINPLVLTGEGKFVALDAKFNFDDNALPRHKDIYGLRDKDEEDPLESRAIEVGLNYVKMDGHIGCMVNGAGLAMATMDIIKYYGGTPANFLDVGGNADKERVKQALLIILSDPNVKAILINIFGGIMRCDIIAEGVISAAKEIGIKVPLIVRLAGTNFELGKKLLSESGLAIIPADDLADAAAKAVKSLSQ